MPLPPAPTSSRVLASTTGPIEAQIHATDKGIFLTVDREGNRVIDAIEIGTTFNGRRVGPASSVLAAKRQSVNETYRKYAGKVVGDRTVRHQELDITFQSEDGTIWGLILRTAADGIAFRYRAPETSKSIELGTEATTVPLDPTGKAWLLEYQTWYETPRFGVDTPELVPGEYGFPALVSTPVEETFILYSESDINGASSGAHLKYDTGAAFSVVTADDPILVDGGHLTPWRVAIIGTLPEIVASELVDDLAPEPDREAAVPTRPGRAAWSWWSSQYSGAYFGEQKRFVDYAAEQGWEHVLVDCGWDAAWMPELVAYASCRGIQIHVWSSWSDLDGAEALEKLTLWRSWGVAGIKVDFMESESQERYQWYDAIIAKTADLGLMVNFHGSVIPRGWAKSHPHVVSYEGIRGAEYYVFYGNPLTAAHNVIQPFTRNVVGSMDYTPVTFSAPDRETSDGHELALSVAYESGITHFADEPEEYRKRPLANRFLAEIAPSWDEVRLLSGHPDTDAIIARRQGRRWFIGAISSGEARTLTVDVSTLVEGPYVGWIVADARQDTREGLLERHIDSDLTPGPISIPVAENGGFGAIIAPVGEALFQATTRQINDPPALSPQIGTLKDNLSAVVFTDLYAKLRAAPGWTVTHLGGGRWSVQAPTDVEPGALCVVTAERPDGDGVAVVSHARVFAPYRQGKYQLSALPFLTAQNDVGPVERNESNGGGDPRDGNTITVAGTQYPTGIGVSDTSTVSFHLGGQIARFAGAVGIDDETPQGSASALIVLDGTPVRTFSLRAGDPAESFDLVTGNAIVLELRTLPDPDGETAHVDWIDPTITH
ncbi:glycoside hydrolase family 97 catalytic domain-containing protein [Arthrobacter sp. NPDC058127]|uniref:glycoside hydrolase family 97 catalytic domain-containing protein n=1 Tax=Arthrobacter sp. NPDC058127 TaxID=3346351 RepID=UPI0036EF9DFA